MQNCCVDYNRKGQIIKHKNLNKVGENKNK